MRQPAGPPRAAVARADRRSPSRSTAATSATPCSTCSAATSCGPRRRKGCADRGRSIKHGLRTALIPMATFFAYEFALLFVGATFTEKIFGWHGMGEYFVDSVTKNDVNSVAGVTLFVAVLVLIAGLPVRRRLRGARSARARLSRHDGSAAARSSSRRPDGRRAGSRARARLVGGASSASAWRWSAWPSWCCCSRSPT